MIIDFRTLSGMDISVFGEDELLSLRERIDEELKRKRNAKEKRLPIDLFAQKARRDIHCPHCGTDSYHSEGMIRKRTVLECNRCHKKFGYLSGSMLESSNLSLAQINQLTLYNVLDLPAWVIAYLTGIDEKTVQFWRYRLTDIANDYLGKQILSDKVWVDETYWKITDKSLIFEKSDGKQLKGLSRNLVCVVVAYDVHKHYYCHVMEKRGKISSDDFYNIMKDRIRPGSVLIHDGEHAHRTIVEKLNLKETVVKSDDTDPAKRRQMETIDSVCSLLKFETYKHKGIRTEHMEELLPWFLFKSEYVTRHGVGDAVDYIMVKLFDAKKTETYEERFKIKRKNR